MNAPDRFGPSRSQAHASIGSERLAATFVELADTLVDDFDLVEFLHLLVDRSAELLDVSATGLMLVDAEGRLRVMAASTEATHVVELFQQQHEEGPCLDCYRTGTAVSHADLATASDRWPRFAPFAVQNGFASVHALPMRLRREVLGALNLFQARPGALDPTATHVGQALADVATIGLIQERAGRRQSGLIDQLQHALDSRILIEQAKGVLAERHNTDPAEGFAMLRRYARHHGHKLTELAAAVVDGTATDLLTASQAAAPQDRPY